MSERQRGLGRGLSALMGEGAAVSVAPPADASAPAAEGLRHAPIELLKPNPDQPRKTFPQAELDELAASIRAKGVLQPILVRPDPSGEGFQIVAGERRWRAAQQARLTDAPIVVREMDDVEVLEVGVIENVQRQDLNPLDEAQAYAVLISKFGRTQDAVAAVVGKSRSHVANSLRLLALPDAVLSLLLDGALTAGHARALITAPDPAGLADKIVREGLNVRQAEALARQAQAGPKPDRSRSPTAASGSADIAALEQDLSDALGLKASLADRNGKGELTLRYASLEQLDELCRRLMRG
ncbi:MAG: ParB/RepB/Spo0J family partition protein [Brevundimonas sp.]|nr:MAG: ParB/RepB/Spo0J family partition protein [Brevundimonas sp.]